MEGLELMIKRIKNILLGENLDIKEQLFRITVMIGVALSIIGMVEEAFGKALFGSYVNRHFSCFTEQKEDRKMLYERE